MPKIAAKDPSKRRGEIQRFIAKGTPETLIEAVLNARKEIEENEKQYGLEAQSDRWVYDLGHFRPLLISIVKKHWATLTDSQSYDCPFTDDRIVHMCICCRKNTYTVGELLADVRYAHGVRGKALKK